MGMFDKYLEEDNVITYRYLNERCLVYTDFKDLCGISDAIEAIRLGYVED